MTYLLLFWTFLKIGLFTIGGGYAMIPLIQHEVIEVHGWMTVEQFAEFVGIAESTPGPFAVNISTFAGMQVAGVAGSLCATLGVVFPSLVIILLVAGIFHQALKHWAVRAALNGAKPAVVGLIGAAGFTLLRHTLMPSGGEIRWFAGILAAVLFVVANRLRVGAIGLIAVGGCLGVALRWLGLSV